MASSGFNMFVKNQSDKDRIVRVVIAVILIATYFALPSTINSSLGPLALIVAVTLLFNATTGTCFIYRALGINTCPLKDSE
mgnify:CR=1 FL=1